MRWGSDELPQNAIQKSCYITSSTAPYCTRQWVQSKQSQELSALCSSRSCLACGASQVPQEAPRNNSRAGLQASVLDNTAAFFAAPGMQEAMYFFGPSSLPQNCVRMLSWCTKSQETCGAWHAWRVKRLNANTCRSVWRNECMGGHVGGTSACAYRREPANLTPSSQAVSFRWLLVVTLRPVLV